MGNLKQYIIIHKKVLSVIGFAFFLVVNFTIGLLFSFDKIGEDLSFFLFIPCFIFMIILAHIYLEIPLILYYERAQEYFSVFKNNLSKK